MKKFTKNKICMLLIIISIIFATIIIACANSIKEVKMYSVDGREILVVKNEVEEYKKVGWYTEPVIKMYALDGRTRVVLQSEIEAYKKVGWYTEPMQMLYAVDKTRIFKKSQVSEQLKVGWYTEPVVKMYATDGRVRITLQSEVEEYKKVGWYLTKEEAQKNNIDKNELELLARTIHAEAADNNYIDKCYVGMVVMNRKKSGKWGNSILSVISAPGQYSSYRNKKFNSSIPSDCYEIAKRIMLGETFGVPYNVIFQSGSPQGSGIWKIVYNTAGYCNHYYCYGNF